MFASFIIVIIKAFVNMGNFLKSLFIVLSVQSEWYVLLSVMCLFQDHKRDVQRNEVHNRPSTERPFTTKRTRTTPQ